MNYIKKTMKNASNYIMRKLIALILMTIMMIGATIIFVIAGIMILCGAKVTYIERKVDTQ